MKLTKFGKYLNKIEKKLKDIKLAILLNMSDEELNLLKNGVIKPNVDMIIALIYRVGIFDKERVELFSVASETLDISSSELYNLVYNRLADMAFAATPQSICDLVDETIAIRSRKIN